MGELSAVPSIDFDLINREAMADLSGLLARLLPDGRRVGHEWVALNPTRADQSPGSFKINMITGAWSDFATGDAGGDPISFCAYVWGTSQSDAARRLSAGQTIIDRPVRKNEPDPGALEPLAAPGMPSVAEMRHRELGECVGSWAYHDASGAIVAVVCRYEPPGRTKEFRPLRYGRLNGRVGWHFKGLDARPLYRLPELHSRPDASVLVVEGEKTADKAARIFHKMCVTMAMHGAKSPHKTDWTPLRGRRVVIWPDHDEPGKAFAQAVAEIATAVGATVSIVDVPDNFPVKWDLADPAPTGADLDAILASASTAQVWPDPDMGVIRQYRREAPPLPIDTFGPWSPIIVDIATSAAAPADYVALGLLACAAGVIGNSRKASPWHGWEEPCILWGGAVGSPSAGKSPALRPLMKVLTDLERDLLPDHEEGLRSWRTGLEAAKCSRDLWKAEVKEAVKSGRPPPDEPDGAIEPDQPPRPRLVVSDTTPEALCAILTGQPRGLTLFRDELAGWLGGFDRYGKGEGERGLWIEAFNGGSFVLDRVKNAGAPTVIPSMSVSIVGGIQPDRLSSLMMSGDDDGLPARFLLTWPDPVVPTRPKPSTATATLARGLGRLFSLEMNRSDDHLEPVILRLDDDAADLFFNWRSEHVAENADVVDRFGGHMGKMPGIALRLALVLDHLWWALADRQPPPNSISARATAAAIGLITEYFVPMAVRCYGDAALPDADRWAGTLARWIVKTRPERVNGRDLYRSVRLPGLGSTDAVMTAIRVLADDGWLVRDEQSSTTPGRKKNDYLVNPLVWRAGS